MLNRESRRFFVHGEPDYTQKDTRVAIARLEGFTGTLCSDCGGKLREDLWSSRRATNNSTDLFYCSICGAVFSTT